MLRIPTKEFATFHSWLLKLIRSLIEFCVAMPDEKLRGRGWTCVQRCLDKQDVGSRAQCFASLIAQCPHANAVSLLITRGALLCPCVVVFVVLLALSNPVSLPSVKSELMGGEGSQWMDHCKRVLFALIFRVPSDEVDLVARHDTLVSAANLLLFLSLRRCSDQDQEVVARIREMYVPALRALLRAVVAKDAHGQGELLRKLSGVALPADEASQRASYQRIVLSSELLLSILARVEELG